MYCSEPSARLLPLVLEDAIEMGIIRRRRFVDRLLARIEQQIVSLSSLLLIYMMIVVTLKGIG